MQATRRGRVTCDQKLRRYRPGTRRGLLTWRARCTRDDYFISLPMCPATRPGTDDAAPAVPRRDIEATISVLIPPRRGTKGHKGARPSPRSVITAPPPLAPRFNIRFIEASRFATADELYVSYRIQRTVTAAAPQTRRYWMHFIEDIR